MKVGICFWWKLAHASSQSLIFSLSDECKRLMLLCIRRYIRSSFIALGPTARMSVNFSCVCRLTTLIEVSVNQLVIAYKLFAHISSNYLIRRAHIASERHLFV